eukprot:COSAG01_NODE_55619_length_323_cov_100.477679_1_plen_72_part_10
MGACARVRARARAHAPIKGNSTPERASGCYRSKPFVQPIKTRKPGARPVLGFRNFWGLAVVLNGCMWFPRAR